MPDRLKKALANLRSSFDSKAEKAYRDRDAEGKSNVDQAYAAGEGRAYGDASDEVRREEENAD